MRTVFFTVDGVRLTVSLPDGLSDVDQVVLIQRLVKDLMLLKKSTQSSEVVHREGVEGHTNIIVEESEPIHW